MVTWPIVSNLRIAMRAVEATVKVFEPVEYGMQSTDFATKGLQHMVYVRWLAGTSIMKYEIGRAHV